LTPLEKAFISLPHLALDAFARPTPKYVPTLISFKEDPKTHEISAIFAKEVLSQIPYNELLKKHFEKGLSYTVAVVRTKARKSLLHIFDASLLSKEIKKEFGYRDPVNKHPIQEILYFKISDSESSFRLLPITFPKGKEFIKDFIIANSPEINPTKRWLYQCSLAHHYLSGEGVSQDFKEAFKHFFSAANNATAANVPVKEKAIIENNLGYCYEHGIGVQVDPVKAASWYQLSADQGNAAGQVHLGLCNKKGFGVAKDVEVAFKYFHLSGAKQSAEALYELGSCYENGIGTPIDPIKAVIYYTFSAVQGDPDAQCRLAFCYENGFGVEKNLKLAFYFYKLSADQGNSDAQCNVGLYYSKGMGVLRDPLKALKYYRKSADLGNASALYNLGICYEKSTLLPKDETEAVKYYLLSANKGDSDAQCQLGFCYANGIGIIQNDVQAFAYFDLSAKQGNPTGQYNLAVCYEKGMGLSSPDLKKAKHYYTLSANRGNIDAQLRLLNM